MEGNKRGLSYRLNWISNIIKNGLFWHGVRNTLARVGLDFMPYYWVREATNTIMPPEIKGENKEFILKRFDEAEISYIKNTIIGIEDKDLIENLRGGQICLGLKWKEEIAAYMFIKRNSLEFRKKYFELKPNESYLHSMYTFEDYRGKNLAPYLRYHSYKFLEREGVDTFYSISEYFNRSTIRFKKKLNTNPIALYLSVVFFRHWVFNFTLKKY